MTELMSPSSNADLDAEYGESAGDDDEMEGMEPKVRELRPSSFYAGLDDGYDERDGDEGDDGKTEVKEAEVKELRPSLLYADLGAGYDEIGGADDKKQAEAQAETTEPMQSLAVNANLDAQLGEIGGNENDDDDDEDEFLDALESQSSLETGDFR
jgi:hypothetical protein